MEVKRYELGGWKVEESEDSVSIGCGSPLILTLFAFLRFLAVSVLIFLLIRFVSDLLNSESGPQKYFLIVLLIFAIVLSLKLLRSLFLVQKTIVNPKLHQIRQIYLSGLQKRVFKYQSLQMQTGSPVVNFELFRIRTEKGYEIFSFADKSDAMRFMEVIQTMEARS